MRQYFRFSLRFLLFLVACVSAVLAREANRARGQHDAVRAIIAARGYVIYDWEKVDASGAPVPLSLFRRWLGNDLFARVDSVHLYGSDQVTDEFLARMVGLRSLRSLWLTGTRVTGSGFAYLGKLDGLEVLDLSETHVTDDNIPSLALLKDLRFLGLYETRLTDTGLLNLRLLTSLEELALGKADQFSEAALEDLSAALPNCDIEAL